MILDICFSLQWFLMFFGYPISTHPIPSPSLNRQDLRDLENMAIQVGGLKLGYIVEIRGEFM